MVGVSRKAQNWSLEVIIALSVFLVIFVLVSVFLFYIPEDPTRDLQFQSQKVGSTLENDILVDDDVVIVDNIEELTGYSCDELKDLFAISSDVCIHFEDLGRTVDRS